jgi:hypothetical protein
MSDESNPLSDFIAAAKREMERMVTEADELETAHRRGRVGDLIRKYNPRHKDKLKNTDGDSNQAADELEGKTGGPEVPDGTGT